MSHIFLQSDLDVGRHTLLLRKTSARLGVTCVSGGKRFSGNLIYGTVHTASNSKNNYVFAKQLPELCFNNS